MVKMQQFCIIVTFMSYEIKGRGRKASHHYDLQAFMSDGKLNGKVSRHCNSSSLCQKVTLLKRKFNQKKHVQLYNRQTCFVVLKGMQDKSIIKLVRLVNLPLMAGWD